MKEKILFQLRGVAVTILTLGALILIPLQFSQPTQPIAPGTYTIQNIQNIGTGHFPDLCELTLSNKTVNDLKIITKYETCYDYNLTYTEQIIIKNNQLYPVIKNDETKPEQPTGKGQNFLITD